MLKIAFNNNYILPLPENHRFPMIKYELIPLQLKHEGLVEEDNFFSPGKIETKWLNKCHTTQYINKLNSLSLSKSEIRKTGFPLSKELIEREYIITEGTRKCVDYAILNGASANIAGGTHHSFQDRGEGFCLFNDVAIGAYYALTEYELKKILVIDLDVHQGNGTASIMKNESRVFTFSMHGAKNYPFKKEISDIDVELEDGIEDDQYLYLLEKNLKQINQLFEPQIIFYISGVDILSTDKLGRLKITREGCRKRDDLVFDYAFKNNLPIITSMGGGYSTKTYDIVEAHCNTFKSMLRII